jgi:hypothetical protein
MGGSKLRDTAANIVVMCSSFNGLMESDEAHANMGRLYGWKLRPWETASEVPLWHQPTNTWRIIRDDYTYDTVDHYVVPPELRDYF